MFDLGWMELLVIGVVALIVVGPKDLPMMFKTVGTFVGKTKRMAREFQSTMNAAADETGLKETTDILKNINESSDPKAFFKKAKTDFLDESKESVKNQAHKKPMVKEKKKDLASTKDQ